MIGAGDLSRHGLSRVIAAGAAAALGTAVALGTAAAMAGALAPGVAAAAVGGVSLILIVALGWVEPLGWLVLTLPLPALYSTEDLRVSPVVALSALVSVGWLLGRGSDREPLVSVRGSALSISALVAAVLLSALFADALGPALRESVNFLLFAALFVLTLDRVTARPSQADALTRWATAAAALAGTAAVIEMAGFVPGRFPLTGTGLFRAAGGFGWPNELAMFFAVVLPLVVYRLRVAESLVSKALAWVALGALGLGLVATFSRGSWLAVTLAPAVLLLVGERRMALTFWGLLLLAAGAVDLATGGALSTRIASTASDTFVAQRLLLTGAGLLMFQANPIVGVGAGGFGDALEQFGPQVSGLFDFVGSAHNGYVHVAAETGIIGLVALVYFIASTWLVLFRAVRRVDGTAGPGARERALRAALLWSFTIACVVSAFEWPFGHGVGEMIVIVAAAGRALAGREAPARADGHPATNP